MNEAIALKTLADSVSVTAGFLPGINYPNATTNEEVAPLTPVTVMFQDETTLGCARNLCSRLLRRFGVRSFQATEWWSATLGVRTFFDLAMTNAVASNILLLALHGHEPLSAGLAAWVRTWACRRAGEDATLVALFVADPGESLPVIPADKFFRHVTRLKGLEYFSYTPRAEICLERVAAAPRAAALSHLFTTATGGAASLGPGMIYHRGGLNE